MRLQSSRTSRRPVARHPVVQQRRPPQAPPQQGSAFSEAANARLLPTTTPATKLRKRALHHRRSAPVEVVTRTHCCRSYKPLHSRNTRLCHLRWTFRVILLPLQRPQLQHRPLKALLSRIRVRIPEAPGSVVRCNFRKFYVLFCTELILIKQCLIFHSPVSE